MRQTSTMQCVGRNGTSPTAYSQLVIKRDLLESHRRMRTYTWDVTHEHRFKSYHNRESISRDIAEYNGQAMMMIVGCY